MNSKFLKLRVLFFKLLIVITPKKICCPSPTSNAVSKLNKYLHFQQYIPIISRLSFEATLVPSFIFFLLSFFFLPERFFLTSKFYDFLFGSLLYVYILSAITSARLSLTQLDSAWLSLTQHDSAWLSLTQCTSARLSRTQLDSVGLSVTQLSQKFPFFWRPFT